jgi:hypothetical protein
MKQTVEEAAKEVIMATIYGTHTSLDDFTYLSHDEIAEAAFIKGAEWQAKQSPWISVEMAIPKDDSPGVVQVITVDGKEGEMAARRVMYNIYPYIKTGYVTHWRPIPALPKGGEG